MPEFIFAYHADPAAKKPQTPEEGKALMDAWRAWVSGMGDAVINPNTPLGQSKTVTRAGVEDNGGSNPLMGYSVVLASDINAAVNMAKTSPFLAMGTIEVAEMKKMPSS